MTSPLSINNRPLPSATSATSSGKPKANEAKGDPKGLSTNVQVRVPPANIKTSTSHATKAPKAPTNQSPTATNRQENADLPTVAPNGEKVPTYFNVAQHDYRLLNGDDRQGLGADDHRRAVFHIMGRQNITTGKPSDGSVYYRYLLSQDQQEKNVTGDPAKDPVLKVLSDDNEAQVIESYIKQEFFQSGGFITGKALEKDFFNEFKAATGEDLSTTLAAKNPGALNHVQHFDGANDPQFLQVQEKIAQLAQGGHLDDPQTKAAIQAQIEAFKQNPAYGTNPNYQHWAAMADVMLNQGIHDETWRNSVMGLMDAQGIKPAGFPTDPTTGEMMRPDDPGFNEALGQQNGLGAFASGVMQLWGHDTLTSASPDGAMLDGDSVLIALTNPDALDRNVDKTTTEALLKADLADDGIRNGSALSRSYLNVLKQVYGATQAPTTLANTLMDALSTAQAEGRTMAQIKQDVTTGVQQALVDFKQFAQDHPFITAGGLTTLAGAAATCPYLAGLAAAGAGAAAISKQLQKPQNT